MKQKFKKKKLKSHAMFFSNYLNYKAFSNDIEIKGKKKQIEKK